MQLKVTMRNLLCAVVALFALAAPCVRAQEQTPPVSPPFRIRLPEYADTNSLEIHYQLRGPFGGYGSFVHTRAGVWEYEIDTSHEGKPAHALKAVIYCAGYQVETLDYPSLAAAPEAGAELHLKPLPTVPLSGTVSLPEGVKAEEVVVNVRFTAQWECKFFGRMECLVPSFGRAASAEVSEGGAFRVALPDYARDPVVGAYERPGFFKLTVSERESGRYLFSLRPKGGTDPSRGIPVAHRYPDGLVFEPEDWK
jgi:hypothetical protein